MPPPGVLLDEAKDGDVLLGIALHQIDQKAPKGRVLYGAQLALEPPQFLRVPLLFAKELFGEIDNRITINGSVEIDVRDYRIIPTQ